MKFRVENRINKDSLNYTPTVRLFVWELVEYGIEGCYEWVEFNIDFMTVASAKSYAKNYSRLNIREEFTA